MIIGTYPCCDGSLFMPIADGELPKIERQECPHCGAVVWHWHSRIEPMSYTDEDFRKEFVIDDEKRTIRRVNDVLATD